MTRYATAIAIAVAAVLLAACSAEDGFEWPEDVLGELCGRHWCMGVCSLNLDSGKKECLDPCDVDADCEEGTTCETSYVSETRVCVPRPD